MGSNSLFKTYFLKGFDKEQTDFISKSLSFISSKIKITNSIEVIDKLNISLTPNDYVLIYIDELSLNQLNDPVNRSFFDKKEYRNNQIILITDDIHIKQLPEQFHYFATFPVISEIDDSFEEIKEWNKNKNNYHKNIDLLYDIAHFIKRSKKEITDNNSLVFVGPYDDNTTYEFHKITRELLHRKCNITPSIFNPSGKELLSNPDYLEEILSSIELAIHFVGYNSLLNYPENLSPSLQLNNNFANFCKTEAGAHIQRIVYIPAIGEDTPEIVVQKIAQFKNDVESLYNAEIIQTPVEKFKEVVISKLKELSISLQANTLKEEEIEDIYFIHPPGTENDIKPQFDFFKTHNFNVSTSQVQLDQLELLNYHQQKLTSCKGVIIYDNGNKEWLMRKLSDIKKSPGWGRKKPFNFKIIISTKENIKKIKEYVDSSIIIFPKDKMFEFKEISTLINK